MPHRLFALSLGFAALILVAQQGHAAPHCGPRATLVAQLADRYRESRRGLGLAANAALVEVFAADTGSWTIITTLPDGTACLVASGENWMQQTEALPVPGDPA